jgi:hypothetical protein
VRKCDDQPKTIDSSLAMCLIVVFGIVIRIKHPVRSALHGLALPYMHIHCIERLVREGVIIWESRWLYTFVFARCMWKVCLRRSLDQIPETLAQT